jgi:hypothetical protein
MQELQPFFSRLTNALTFAALLVKPACWKLPGNRKAQLFLATIASVLTLAVLLAEPAAAGSRPPGTNHNDTLVRI